MLSINIRIFSRYLIDAVWCKFSHFCPIKTPVVENGGTPWVKGVEVGTQPITP